MPDRKSRPPQNQPWESGWTPDTSRVPGTRRLWLAGALALATVASCVTAIFLTDEGSDDRAMSAPGATPAANTTDPGLISFASPSTSGATTPSGKSRTPSPRPTTHAPGPHGSASAPPPEADPPKSPTPHPSPSATKPQITWRSVRSANYPDRYWHVSGSYVGLDRVSSASDRQDATFKLVKGLADTSCYSFATSDGTYLRHRDFVLRAERDDGSTLFKQDATFCPHYWSPSGTLSLESVNYPGRFLRHRDFQIRLDPYENSHQYHSDASFQMVAGLA
jgi:hypothetical protein